MAGSGSGGESSPAEDRATGSSSTTTATTTTTPTPSINRSDDDHNDHDTGASSVIPNEPPRSSIDLRWAALAEVYNTERDYIGDLELIRQVFVAPLQSERIIDEKTMYNIFSNIEVILGCNKEFFRCLCEVPHATPSIEKRTRSITRSITHSRYERQGLSEWYRATHTRDLDRSSLHDHVAVLQDVQGTRREPPALSLSLSVLRSFVMIV